MRLGRFLLFISICIFLQGCVSPKMSQEVQLGKILFSDGEYKSAFRRLMPAAVCGNAQAQYAVGYMYYYGYGVAHDTESGLFWMDKAAAQGYKPAIKALQKIHEGPQNEGPCREGGSCRNRMGSAGLSYKGDNSAVSPSSVETHAYQPRPAHVKRTYTSYLKRAGYPVNHLEPQSILSAQESELAAQVNKEYSELSRVNQVQKSKPENSKESNAASQQRNSEVLSTVAQPQKSKLSDAVKQPQKTEIPKVVNPPALVTKPKTAALNQSMTMKSFATTEPQLTSNQYALQLFGAYHLVDVKNLQTELDLGKGAKIFHTKNKDKDWYVLTYGNFSSVAEAKVAQNHISATVSELQPWIRKLNGLDAVG